MDVGPWVSSTNEVSGNGHLILTKGTRDWSELGRGRRVSTANRTPGGASTARRSEADGIVSGRSHGRQRAVCMSATGQFRARLWAVSRVRCHSRHAQVRTSAEVVSVHSPDPRCHPQAEDTGGASPRPRSCGSTRTWVAPHPRCSAVFVRRRFDHEPAHVRCAAWGLVHSREGNNLGR